MWARETQKHNIILPKVGTSMVKNAVKFSAAGPYLSRNPTVRSWNELPTDIKEAQSIGTFSLEIGNVPFMTSNLFIVCK